MVNRAGFSLFLKFVISTGLFLALLWVMRKNIGEIFHILKNSNKAFLAIAATIGLSMTFGMAFRLKLLMSAQGIRLPGWDFIYLTFIGYFFNNFFPTSIGGDIVKAHYASRKTNNRPSSYAAVIADRIVGFMSILSIAIIGLIFMENNLVNNKITWAIWGMAAILIISVVMLLVSKKGIELSHINFGRNALLNKAIEKIFKLYNAINLYRHKFIVLVKAYLLAILTQSGAVVSIYFFVQCLGGNIHMGKLFLFMPLIWAVSMLPSLNGLGVREGAFVYFLKGDLGIEMAFAISLLWLGLMIISSIIGGLMHLLYPVKTEEEVVSKI